MNDFRDNRILIMDGIYFLTTLKKPIGKEIDAVEEYLNTNMRLSDHDSLLNDIELFENDFNLDPYNYDLTVKELHHSLIVLKRVESFKKRVLKDQKTKDKRTLSLKF